jgi:hypothetical protein
MWRRQLDATTKFSLLACRTARAPAITSVQTRYRGDDHDLALSGIPIALTEKGKKPMRVRHKSLLRPSCTLGFFLGFAAKWNLVPPRAMRLQLLPVPALVPIGRWGRKPAQSRNLQPQLSALAGGVRYTCKLFADDFSSFLQQTNSTSRANVLGTLRVCFLNISPHNAHHSG